MKKWFLAFLDFATSGHGRAYLKGVWFGFMLGCYFMVFTLILTGAWWRLHGVQVCWP